MADSKLGRNYDDDETRMARWENIFLEISLWALKYRKKFWFFGNETAKSLEYTEPKKAIQDHIDSEDKKSIERLLGKDYKSILLESLSTNDKPLFKNFLQKLHPNYTMIKEVGLYSLCVKSRKTKAKPFQKWIFNTIEIIRDTGSYTLPGGPIDNPLSLIDKVSNLEKEIIKTIKKKETCDRETQTQEISIKKFKNRLERSILRAKKIELELEKSLKEISLSYFHSSSSSSQYSSDSE